MDMATEDTRKDMEALLNRALGGAMQEADATDPEAPAPVPPTRDGLLERGWAALPASYRIPEVAPTLEQARAYCRQLAEAHYENFHVATGILPRALRPYFQSIYAYCRI